MMLEDVDLIVFDCDGVLADTERDGHRVSFNKVFQEKGYAIAKSRWSKSGSRSE